EPAPFRGAYLACLRGDVGAGPPGCRGGARTGSGHRLGLRGQVARAETRLAGGPGAGRGFAAGPGIPMNTCPPTEILERLLAGDLPDAEADSVRTHLTTCGACQGRLDRLSDHAELRGWAGAGLLSSPPPPEFPGCLGLLEGLARTPTPEASALAE